MWTWDVPRSGYALGTHMDCAYVAPRQSDGYRALPHAYVATYAQSMCTEGTLSRLYSIVFSCPSPFRF
jgi:hypothetical protein